jgi:hypothetical protein
MPENPITLSMSLDNCNLVLNILGEQPFNRIAPLVMDLRMQAERQFQAVAQGQGMNIAPTPKANGSASEHAA